MLQDSINLDFRSPNDVVRTLSPDEPILCISKKCLKLAVQNFTLKFDGTTLYAIKCNPHPFVILSLFEMGIKDFDVASLREIEVIKSLIPQAKCYFNHPIKTRKAITSAYYDYGIRDFVVDSREELKKLTDQIKENDFTVQFRLNTRSGSLIYDFAHKFGMTSNEIIDNIHIIKEKKLNWALSFHVGSQCENPFSYMEALVICRKIIDQVKMMPDYINVGGGFPGYYPERKIIDINRYFEIISQAKKDLDLPLLLCEPGRALVCHAGKLIVQVVLRKGNKLYINDGVYGSLGEIDYANLRLNVKPVNPNKTFSDTNEEFTIFGPTCDSYDVLEYKFCLPNNIDEGDWVQISDLGAYSTSLTSKFNGFSSDKICIIS